MRYYDTLIPYRVIEYEGIEYGTCYDYEHISRYRVLRTVKHLPKSTPFVTLETPNTIKSNMPVKYYTVRAEEENRLDLIAHKYLGSARYQWVIAYLNEIEDGFSVYEGQKIKVPASQSVVSFLESGEMLASVPATYLNLGAE